MPRTQPLPRLLILAALAAAAVLPMARAAVTQPSTATRGLGAQHHPLKSIAAGMQNAQDRLHHGDTGDQTRAIQQRVVDDLQKAIDEAKKQPPQTPSGNPSQGGASSGKESQDQNADHRSGPENMQSQPASDRGAGPRSARKPASGKPSPTAITSPAATIRRSLLRDVWGHLPPALRERVPADFGETVLPAYDELVRRYFEALLDDSSPPKSAGQRVEPPTPHQTQPERR